jgi:hypothetical protein
VSVTRGCLAVAAAALVAGAVSLSNGHPVAAALGAGFFVGAAYACLLHTLARRKPPARARGNGVST